MKIGLRTPSLKKRVRARTTGKIKRQVKGAINPLYGMKGMGYVKNPKRAIKKRFTRRPPLTYSACLKSYSSRQEVVS